MIWNICSICLFFIIFSKKETLRAINFLINSSFWKSFLCNGKVIIFQLNLPIKDLTFNICEGFLQHFGNLMQLLLHIKTIFQDYFLNLSFSFYVLYNQKHLYMIPQNLDLLCDISPSNPPILSRLKLLPFNDASTRIPHLVRCEWKHPY